MMLDADTHKNILIRILKDIYTDATIGPFLGFKGGTAALVFYDLNRFSVDLDFDLLDASKEKYIFEQIKKILEGYGTIKQSEEKRFTIFFRLAYKDNHQNIKVEINHRDFGSQYEVKSYLGISMKVMVREDMAANKMVAMMERKANRDIFDTYFFLKNNWSINELIIKKRTGLSMRQFLKGCIEKLEHLNNRGILSGLGELLNAQQKEWVKNKLRTETIFLLQLKLENYQGQPHALLHSYKEGENLLDPSGLGSSFYKEYKSDGIYDRSTSPAKAVISFDKKCSDAFLDKALQFIKKSHELNGVRSGQTLNVSAYLSKDEIQKLVDELNQHFED